MRSALRILVCLVAWLMLSPIAMAAPPCNTTSSAPVLACCEEDEHCAMPAAAMPTGASAESSECPKCEPAPLSLALPAIVLDTLPPLEIAFEAPAVFTALSTVFASPLTAVQFSPPASTLLSLGTQLTC